MIVPGIQDSSSTVCCRRIIKDMKQMLFRQVIGLYCKYLLGKYKLVVFKVVTLYTLMYQ
jgi:hypothetical protein